jgi:hypothetical protein
MQDVRLAWFASMRCRASMDYKRVSCQSLEEYAVVSDVHSREKIA